MVSKALVVLGFLLVAVVLISSEVSARELAENADVEAKDPVNGAQQYGGGGGYPGRGYPGRGYPGRGYPGRGYPGRGYPGRGCQYGCCGQGYGYGGHCRCCSYQGEVPDVKAEAEPHN